MTGTAAVAPLQDLKNNPAATNVTMPDDASVYVPLGFTFPYFGQNFTQSWMYSNGAVNFSGTTRSNFCCGGLNLSQLSDPSYNYTVVPLWTDLIAIQGGSHYILGTSDSMTYGWYGVSEYYDASKRSSFEVKIDSSGLLDVRFSGALVSSHVVTSGFIGDITKGEYYQYHYGYGFNTGPLSYTVNGSTPTPTPNTSPCGVIACPTANESSSVVEQATAPTTVVEQPVQVAQTTTTTPVETQQTTTAATTTTTTQPTTTATVASTPAPTATNPQPRVGEVQVAGSAAKPTVSLSQILSIVSQEQSRISNVEKTVVNEAVQQAQAAGAQATANAEKTASAAVTASMSTSSVGSTSSTTQNVQQSTSSSVVAIGSVTPGAVNVMQPPMQVKNEDTTSSSSQTSTGQQNIELYRPVQVETQVSSFTSTQQEFELQKPTTVVIESAQQNLQVFVYTPPPQQEVVLQTQQPVAYTPPKPVAPEGQVYQAPVAQSNKPVFMNQSSLLNTEPIKVEVAKVEARDIINNANEKIETVEQPTQQQSSVRRDTRDNDAAGNVTIASIATQPVGFNAYSYVLKDAPFYAVKEIYKNQAVVDNARAMRQLSSDRLHQQMVDQQYKGN